MDVDSVPTEEGWLTTSDGHKLYTKTWKPESTPKARLVFLHGYSDHSNFYTYLFNHLASQGIKVYSFDQRGWGRSVHEHKQRGLTGPTEQVMDDITSFIKQVLPDEKGVPLFLMGHSMGGGETLVYAATGPKDIVSQIRGFLVEAPLIGLTPTVQPWKSTVVIARLASKLFPRATMVNKLVNRRVQRTSYA